MATATRETIFECVNCKREYINDPPPLCNACYHPLMQRPDRWGGVDVSSTPPAPRIVSASLMKKKLFDMREAGPVFKALFGAEHVPELLSIGVSGKPSSGKTTWAMKLADDGTYQRPLLAAAEEGISQAVSDRIARLGLRRLAVTDASTVPAIIVAARAHSADLVVVDSATAASMGSGDMQVLRAEKLSLIVVIQTVDQGRHHAGGESWKHNADVFVWCEALKWKVEKSWNGSLLEGSV